MPESDDDYIQLADFLRERGHTELEVEKIIAHVREYEAETQLYSVMDSIADGHLNLTNIISEALGSGGEAADE
ncbi:hypothetical protein GC176_23860 [bacterium]|nr:hypothetical protein [bacterium]